jgi:hypothetical protein
MRGVSRRVIRLLSHIRVISSVPLLKSLWHALLLGVRAFPARMRLRHVTATDVGAASVLKMVDELLRSESHA